MCNHQIQGNNNIYLKNLKSASISVGMIPLADIKGEASPSIYADWVNVKLF